MKKIRIFLVVTLFAALKPVMADTNKAIPNQAYYTTPINFFSNFDQMP
jgi:hypothetical protein